MPTTLAQVIMAVVFGFHAESRTPIEPIKDHEKIVKFTHGLAQETKDLIHNQRLANAIDEASAAITGIANGTIEDPEKARKKARKLTKSSKSKVDHEISKTKEFSKPNDRLQLAYYYLTCLNDVLDIAVEAYQDPSVTDELKDIEASTKKFRRQIALTPIIRTTKMYKDFKHQNNGRNTT